MRALGFSSATRWIAPWCAVVSVACAADDAASGREPVNTGEPTSSASPVTSDSAGAVMGNEPVASGASGAAAQPGGSGGIAGALGASVPSATNSALPSGAGGVATGAGAGGSGGAAAGRGNEPSGGAAGSDESGAGALDAGTNEAGSGAMPDATSGDAGVAGSSNTGDVAMTAGCGKTPTLQNSPSTAQFDYNTVTSAGVERRYLLRLPDDYDNTHPYRLILGFHGASNNATHVAGSPAYFGLYELAEGSTIFVAPEAVDGLWSETSDVTLVDDILEQVEADLCIDPTRVIVQGFSQGAAMVRVLACARPGVFRAAVGHSAGGLPLPSSCEPIPYLGSLGTQESGGGGQLGQTELFATAAGCAVETLPDAPSGGHVCSDYSGCSAEHPVRWCSFDAGHTPLPNDAGQNSSWMPAEVWAFLAQF